MEQEIISAFKDKKWYKKKWPYFVATGVLIAAGAISVRMGDKGTKYETVEAERGSLTQTVDATGKMESADVLDLRFETAGRIGAIYKKTGDEVKVGEALADLRLDELNAQVAKANAAVDKAQANLDKLLAGSTGAYLASLQAAVDQAQANLDKITAQYDNTIANARAALETARINLELSAGGEDSQIVQDAYDDLLALLQTVQNSLAAALTEADNILGIDNPRINDDFEDILSASQPNKLPPAEYKYYAARTAKNNFDLAANSLNSASSHAEFDQGADMGEEALFVMKDLLYALAVVLDNTTAISGLSQTDLNAMKTDIQTARTNVSTQYANLIDQQQAVAAAKNSYDTNLIAFDKAKANLANLEKEKLAETAAYQALLDKAQASYDDAYNPPRAEDIASYEAALAEARAGLASAIANRNKARIMAPVDGVVGKVNSKAGEYLTASEVVVKLISPHFEIKVDIPETDIVKISLGNEARIILDAYPEAKFAGLVTEIEKGETIIQDVVYYTVTVALVEQTDKEIFNGLTADVVFYTEQRDNVLYLPLRAVRTNGQGRYVRVLVDGEVVEKEVKLGLRGDGGLVEIIDGLEESEEVVLAVIE